MNARRAMQLRASARADHPFTDKVSSTTPTDIIMKLFYSPNSPYVRKVMMAAIELGIDAELEKAAVTLSPYEPNPAVTAENPLGKIPVMVTTD